MAVYAGTCSVLIVDDKTPAKPCVGSLMLNRFPSGRRAIIFHDGDGDMVAFQATPHGNNSFVVTAVERNGQSDPATGTCAIQIGPDNTGHVACEAHASGRLTSATMQVTTLRHEIGMQ